MKIMEKAFITKEDKVQFVLMEKNILSKMSHSNIVKLYYTFQDKKHLYMVMELARGGELLGRVVHHHNEMQALGRIDEAMPLPMAKFYAAQLVCALEYVCMIARCASCAARRALRVVAVCDRVCLRVWCLRVWLRVAAERLGEREEWNGEGAGGRGG